MCSRFYVFQGLGSRSDVFPIYIGDDRTDEDAFKVFVDAKYVIRDSLQDQNLMFIASNSIYIGHYQDQSWPWYIGLEYSKRNQCYVFAS